MRLLLTLACLSLFLLTAHAQTDSIPKPPPTIAKKTANMDRADGYFPYYQDNRTGKVYLQIDRIGEDFLYVNGLTAGLGSNDIGLDRNQLGDNRVVRFRRYGPKVLLEQPNLNYRALSNNPDEAASVAEAFAGSVLEGFKIEAENPGGAVLIDLTPFLLRDAHGVVQRLKQRKQGTYKLDDSRSVLYPERTKNFPLNTEFEALLTFTGEPTGSEVKSVAAGSDALTLRMHHSFVKLPDDDFPLRPFDPRSGFYPLTYADYATPIDQPLIKRFIQRHRLVKKTPGTAPSEAVNPIVYYVDRGAPEPIRSALIEGASWWNQAFEAAGYINAFQVKLLPAAADPMDVRYNVINWVHRSSRGWSYGSSVSDPRTGEIIKGHVLLGSLRVRQDFLIAQGILDSYAAGDGTEADPRLLEMALARLRQLSAHEVGHTLGLMHNFAASADDRASVMDYPHPFVQPGPNSTTDLTEAYATGIGEWDKRTIIYGYADLGTGAAEKQALSEVLAENARRGFRYLTDADARPVGSAHPEANLWDNGKSATDELVRLTAARRRAIFEFGPENIPAGMPLAALENVFVPVYLMHRYQVEAAAKTIGGVRYEYGARAAENEAAVTVVPLAEQRAALEALLETLRPGFLLVPQVVLQYLPPQPPGYDRDRENFKGNSGVIFDPTAAARASVDHTFTYLLNAERLNRLAEQAARDDNFDLHPSQLFEQIEDRLRSRVSTKEELGTHLARMTQQRYAAHLMRLASDKDASFVVQAAALDGLQRLYYNIGAVGRNNSVMRAHYTGLRHQIDLYMADPNSVEIPAVTPLPDGSPIGCGQ
ncbi:MAG: zinc-dependent metalloprotease [Saprospiraceae bacterium]